MTESYLGPNLGGVAEMLEKAAKGALHDHNLYPDEDSDPRGCRGGEGHEECWFVYATQENIFQTKLTSLSHIMVGG